ncbi:hypothetical protein [Ulvibacter antarcticus]|uniref:Uncharacterized protein n=1 Tax=Ulvibacter antarcticus TaxID=442714 RepID=A0A3L9YWH2_9FLAO|nr:hypothetical protein [Ulvibacter antarcticus]RMA58822.1 hypothetical protein BXY75_2201 [Ulvibacter antarcticus]
MKLTTILAYISISTFTLSCYAQVGIRSNNPRSILDISASNKVNPTSKDGILLPRIENFPTTNPTADQDGLLVFLVADTGTFQKGLHYWDNSLAQWLDYGAEWRDGYNDDDEDLMYARQAAVNGVDVVIQDSGRIGMGTKNPEESLELKFAGDNDIQITSAEPPNAPNLIFFTTNGTFSSRQQLNDNDPLGAINGKVWNGTAKSGDVAYISPIADGDHSSGNLPTKYDLSVTGNGDETAYENGLEMTIRATGRVGIGTGNPTAALQLKAGTATANSAPLKLTPGTKLSTPETGTIEYDGTSIYFTPNSSRRLLLTGLKTTATLNFPIIINGLTDELSVTVPGAAVGSSCDCNPLGAIETGLQWSCYVSSANTVRVRLNKITTGPLDIVDPASRNWRILVME